MMFVNATEVEDAIKLFAYNKDNKHQRKELLLSRNKISEIYN
jgi:hypothetical protein